jgi:hypothetical protein
MWERNQRLADVLLRSYHVPGGGISTIRSLMSPLHCLNIIDGSTGYPCMLNLGSYAVGATPM